MISVADNSKVLQKPVPWPRQGTRRASIHSFGCNGANTHLILDDAYNSLSLAGLEGRHCTIKKPPLVCGSGTKDNATQRLNEILIQHQSEEKKAQKRSAAKLLVWSVHDKDGVSRLSQAWHSYFVEACISNLGKKDYLRNLSFTLIWRRNHLDWRTFVVANSTQSLEDLTRSVSPVLRALPSPKIAFIFTGVRLLYIHFWGHF